MNYTLIGKNNNQTLLFVHGLGANRTQFEDQHRFFSEEYKVLSVDLPGHGVRSEKNANEFCGFTLKDAALELLILLDTLSIETFHFIGNSLGGNIGYEILKSSPERLLSFSTFGTTAELRTGRFSLWLMKLTYQLLSSSTIAKLASSSGISKASKEKIREMMMKVPKNIIQQIVPVIANFNYLDTIKESSTPAMIMKGSKDQAINKVLKSTLEAYEEHPDFTLSELKDLGHFANLDNPMIFNNTIYEFLKDK